jgi:hypothetical protein
MLKCNVMAAVLMYLFAMRKIPASAGNQIPVVYSVASHYRPTILSSSWESVIK